VAPSLVHSFALLYATVLVSSLCSYFSSSFFFFFFICIIYLFCISGRHWEDHGIPDPQLLLDSVDLLEQYRMETKVTNEAPHMPIVVNCHGGVGRTGTWVLIQALYGWLISLSEASTSAGSPRASATPADPFGLPVNLGLLLLRYRLQRDGVQGEKQLALVSGIMHDLVRRKQGIEETPLFSSLRNAIANLPARFTRAENVRRMAAYCDSVRASTAFQQRWLASQQLQEIKTPEQFEQFTVHLAGVLCALFEGESDEAVERWVSRFCKLHTMVLRVCVYLFVCGYLFVCVCVCVCVSMCECV
jgi:Protein-tyrosine phosphatase